MKCGIMSLVLKDNYGFIFFSIICREQKGDALTLSQSYKTNFIQMKTRNQYYKNKVTLNEQNVFYVITSSLHNLES